MTLKNVVDIALFVAALFVIAGVTLGKVFAQEHDHQHNYQQTQYDGRQNFQGPNYRVPHEHDLTDPGHWFQIECCSRNDCREVPPSDVTVSPEGFRVKGRIMAIPFDHPGIRPTPPEGGFQFGLCTDAGMINTSVICLYVPSGT